MRLRGVLQKHALLSREGTVEDVANTTTPAAAQPSLVSGRNILFVIVSAVLLVSMWSTVTALINYAWDFENKNASQVFLIPFVSAGLLVLNRSKIFSRIEYALAPAILVATGGVGLVILSQVWGAQLIEGDRLALATGGLIVLWIAAFLGFYGPHAFKAALFPLLFLVFAIPIPSVILDPLVAFLRRGSADISFVLLRMTGTPVFRQGMSFQLPGFSLQVAPECSGIHSTLVLFITSLLAGYLLLNAPWKQAALTLFVIPLALLRNGFRIVTVGLLCVHVSPDISAKSRKLELAGTLALPNTRALSI